MRTNSNTRRRFLQAAGITVALPLLESGNAHAGKASTSPAQRLVCIGTYLGFHQKAFYPQASGFNYETSELLQPIDHLRDDFTVFSGLDHRAGNGHGNWSTFLAGQKNNQNWKLDWVKSSSAGAKAPPKKKLGPAWATTKNK